MKITFRQIAGCILCAIVVLIFISISKARHLGVNFENSTINFRQTSRFSFQDYEVTKTSLSYDVNKQISCFFDGCGKVNNYRALRNCENPKATKFNELGVEHLNRYMNGELSNVPGYHQNSLQDSKQSFQKAVLNDPHCRQALFNLASVYLMDDEYVDAYRFYNLTLSMTDDEDDLALTHLFMGLASEFLDFEDGSKFHYLTVQQLSKSITKEFFGVSNLARIAEQEVYKFGKKEDLVPIRNIAMYKYFSHTSISEYALLDPGTQDFFIENKYFILRKIVPPFVLENAARCYRDLINNGVLKFGDGQSQRYSAYNDRCARLLHFSLTDLIRKVIAHNARPSYTYFGGYRGGSELKPHVDRAQCEFTLSLSLEQVPHNETWLLSLGKKPLFEREEDMKFRKPPVLPPEDEIVDADLYVGDGLLFMGRHLVHFRRGKLKEGSIVNQVFLHYVQENFAGKLN